MSKDDAMLVDDEDAILVSIEWVCYCSIILPFLNLASVPLLAI